jgi:hypothetical protein
MSETGPETEVISCPACNHLLRVPLDWLGAPVQCPECKARFKAPARDGSGGLTAAELISRPEGAAGAPARKADMMLLLPAFGLLVCGIAGVIINGLLSYRFVTDPAGSKEYLQAQFANARQFGFGADDPEAERDRIDAARAERTAGQLRWVLPAFAAVSALVLVGGLSIVLRWKYRLAQLGCVAAVLNIPHLCCVPGSIAGVWGLIMLASEEGREHFRA